MSPSLRVNAWGVAATCLRPSGAECRRPPVLPKKVWRLHRSRQLPPARQGTTCMLKVPGDKSGAGDRTVPRLAGLLRAINTQTVTVTTPEPSPDKDGEGVDGNVEGCAPAPRAGEEGVGVNDGGPEGEQGGGQGAEKPGGAWLSAPGKAWLGKAKDVPKGAWQYLAKLATPVQLEQGTKVGRRVQEPDEVHYVRIPATAWEIALWRYTPPGGRRREQAVFMLPGCASNAQSFDLAPNASLARHLAREGYDTWVVEMRGIGISRYTAAPPTIRRAIAAEGSDGEPTEAFWKRRSWRRWAREKLVWDVDTYIKEDLPAAIEYINSVTEASRLVGIGHSMGGMILYARAGLDQQADAAMGAPPTGAARMDGIVVLGSGFKVFGADMIDMDTIDEDDKTTRMLALQAPQAKDWSTYAQLARIGKHAPELTHILPVPVDIMSQVQAAFVLPWTALLNSQIEEWVTWVQERSQQTALFNRPAVAPLEAEEAATTTSPRASTAYAKPDPYVKRALRAGTSSTTTALKGGLPSPLLRRLLESGFETVPLALLIQMTTLYTPGGLQGRKQLVGGEEVPGINYRELMRDVQIPVLAISGGADPVIPPSAVKDTADLIPNAQYKCAGKCFTGDVPLDMVDADEDYFSHYDILAGTKAKQEVFSSISEFLAHQEPHLLAFQEVAAPALDMLSPSAVVARIE